MYITDVPMQGYDWRDPEFATVIPSQMVRVDNGASGFSCTALVWDLSF